MAVNAREVAEGTQIQGADERVTYGITTTNWASSPTSPSMVVKNEAGTDVTSTVAPTGSVTASGDVITLKPIGSLTAGALYRVEVKFTAGAYAPAECYFYIRCEE